MKWNSPWSIGYPGWHVECSVMSKKYLGETFDIHGGGMDNIFPHHECEIAQSEAANNAKFVNYFIHNNLVTVNGQKMGKSLGNFITLPDLFKDYNPIIIRFFILLNHYRKPTDFNKDGLEEAKKNYEKLVSSVNNLRNEIKDKTEKATNKEIEDLKNKFVNAMNDDFNTGLAISYLYEGCKIINKELLGEKNVNKLNALNNFITECGENILGLTFTNNLNFSKEKELIEIINTIRNKFRDEKNYEESDKIRNDLNKLGITLNDRKN